MTMEVEFNPSESKEDEEMTIDEERDDIITFLALNDKIFFKSQQKWEDDLTIKEKYKIALNIFEHSKLNFLLRFGKYLKQDQLKYFEQFIKCSEPDYTEIDLVLKELNRNISENAHHVDVKNRRYTALRQMIEDTTYFSEIEMMKRNPLLYEQLVGQYLTLEEKKERDKYKMDDQTTFVKILMEGIERDNAELVRKNQESIEDSQMEEEDSSDEDSDRRSPLPSTSRWGEFEESQIYISRRKSKNKIPAITAQERLLLKEEFITTMYQNFLDGKDEDFNYDTVDNNSSYDNLHEIDHDEEDKYFASEDPEEAVDVFQKEESSEDELDMYMNALNQHPSVCQLSDDLKKI